MIEGLILGIIQGITEWLPVSSSGILTLVSLEFFGNDLTNSISMAVFLHLGTFLAALVYFWKDVINILKGRDKKVLYFLILATFITGLIGWPILILGLKSIGSIAISFIIAGIGLLLIATGLIQLKKPATAFKSTENLKKTDALLVGGLQGLSVIPGFSRSGLTIAGFLFRKFKETEALRLSFLMSLPAVLGGNIVLNLAGINNLELNALSLIALAASFLVGIATIKFLLKISQKINFGWFAIGFGVLTLISLFFV